eukprot:1661416-Prymnesium_polylepis.2
MCRRARGRRAPRRRVEGRPQGRNASEAVSRLHPASVVTAGRGAPVQRARPAPAFGRRAHRDALLSTHRRVRGMRPATWRGSLRRGALTCAASWRRAPSFHSAAPWPSRPRAAAQTPRSSARAPAPRIRARSTSQSGRGRPPLRRLARRLRVCGSASARCRQRAAGRPPPRRSGGRPAGRSPASGSTAR